MSAKVHVLKTWRSYFEAVVEGRKRFELRQNDRDFGVGDVLRLVEWIPDGTHSRTTTRVFHVLVTYLAQGVFGLPGDLCVMSIAPLDTGIQTVLTEMHDDDRAAKNALAAVAPHPETPGDQP